jgi:predicted Fe-Mo cluster-binding NifX family protein
MSFALVERRKERHMKVAVAAWEGRVSPVFDTAQQVALFEIAGQEAEACGEASLSDEEPTRRIQRLRDLGVGTLICGAVSRPVAAMIQMAGIHLIPFIAGPMDDVLKAYVEGTLTTPAFQMPGCCGERRRFRGGRGCNRE